MSHEKIHDDKSLLLEFENLKFELSNRAQVASFNSVRNHVNDGNILPHFACSYT